MTEPLISSHCTAEVNVTRIHLMQIPGQKVSAIGAPGGGGTGGSKDRRPFALVS